jgi:RNA polymerase sigma factor (sigma-70 family)
MNSPLTKIGANPPNTTLSKEEEHDLALKAQQGDKASREALVEANLRLVASIARRYKGMGYEDLYQEGCVGLVKAVDTFDPDRGTAFSTWAVPCIRSAIADALENSDSVHVPRSVYYGRKTVWKAIDGFYAAHGREPSDAELLSITGLTAVQLRDVRAAQASTVSLSASIDADLELAETVAADENTADDAEHSLLYGEVIELMHELLTFRERLVIGMHFGLNGSDPRNLPDIAKVLRVGRETARHVLWQGLAKLRKHYDRDHAATGLRQVSLFGAMIEQAA